MDDLKRGAELPPRYHVLRHCSSKDLLRELDDTISRIQPEAFAPNDDGVSVTCLEIFGGSPDAQVLQARAAMGSLMTLRKRHRLARLKVQTITDVGKDVGVLLSVILDPIQWPPGKENPGHSLITGIPDEIGDLHNRLALSVNLQNDLLPAA